MSELSFLSRSVKETIYFARLLSHYLKKGDVLAFIGDLGSGKTTFIKGLAKGLDIKRNINSPSFVILKIYFNKIPFYHFDLYRLKSLKELENMGWGDFILNSGICAIEWADRMRGLLPKQYLKIKMQINRDDQRRIKLTAYGDRFNSVVDKMAHKLCQ